MGLGAGVIPRDPGWPGRTVSRRSADSLQRPYAARFPGGVADSSAGTRPQGSNCGKVKLAVAKNPVSLR